MVRSITLSSDLGRPLSYAALALALASLVLLSVELGRRRKAGLLVAATGLVATALLALAVLRPASVFSRGSLVGPRVVVLADRSRSIDLRADGGTRGETLVRAVADIKRASGRARLRILGFGEGAPVPWDPTAPTGGADVAPAGHSDLGAALMSLAGRAEERPASIVVVSDGRLDRPSENLPGPAVIESLRGLKVPVHTVSLASTSPPDARIRSVRAPGAAVAHPPLPPTSQIGFDAGLPCQGLTVHAPDRIHGG